MKHNKKNEPNSNKLESTQNHLNSFIEGLKEVSEELSEGEFEQYLKIDILPGLVEDKTVYGDSIWGKMDVVKTVQIDSILEERGLNMEMAVMKMDVDSVCWILEHLWAIKGVINGPAAIESKYRDSLKEDYIQLQEWIYDDMFERIQGYEHEIKELREVKS